MDTSGMSAAGSGYLMGRCPPSSFWERFWPGAGRRPSAALAASWGLRPIDLHLSGLRMLGAEIDDTGGTLRCQAGKLRGGRSYWASPPWERRKT